MFMDMKKVSAFVLAFGLAFPCLPVAAESGIETKAREALLLDFETGTVLLSKNASVQMPPSSMSKLMTTVMVFERLKEGSLSLDEKFRVSENAWRKGGSASGGSTMFLPPNSEARVEDLLRGVIIQSGNDACIALAENISGSEEAFAEAMNRRAQEIGLHNSHFVNATGLPDQGHYMTAHDLATLARYIINHFPEFYSLYSELKFTFNGIVQHNRNPLLYNMQGADGLKTGHTQIAGYGLTASAKIGDRRQILVINGLKSMQERSDEAQKLMDWGFRNFENKTVFTAGETISTAEVWMGTAEAVALTVPQDLRLTLPRRAAQTMEAKVTFTGPIPAPITKGAEIAKLVITGQDMAEPIVIPLQAATDVERQGFLGRMATTLRTLLFGRLAEAVPEVPALPAPAGPAAKTGG